VHNAGSCVGLAVTAEATGRLGPLSGPASLFVGPEGGWSPDEVGQAPATCSLGPRNLRAENAAAAAVAIALSRS
jgi:16S rRNA U1498 N3-methylase RsmE